MKKRLKQTKRLTVGSALSVGLLICMFATRSAARSGHARRLQADRELEQAAAERMGALSAYDEAHVASVRAQEADFRRHLGNRGTVETALRSLGPRWVRQSESSSEHGRFATTTERFAMTSPKPADWPVIVDTVEALERLPGAGIRELELRSTEGALDEASLVLVFDMAKVSATEISR
jgi:hypothetical protein